MISTSGTLCWVLVAPVAFVIACRQWLGLKDWVVCVCVCCVYMCMKAGSWPSISLHLASELHGVSPLGLVWAASQPGSLGAVRMLTGGSRLPHEASRETSRSGFAFSELTLEITWRKSFNITLATLLVTSKPTHIRRDEN